ncbi:hypothetical protein HK097_008375 [Rhizophlyctis rosea]|uniref:Coiled-coil domain-containing protein 189 n=1 Tax=Rhizophlyctis rosea TaxID=64517 RepID=A0AAD5SCG6_9FUNG|nr:hypothetical protein HK097_008375 [Rhizophlyctis rosea]
MQLIRRDLSMRQIYDFNSIKSPQDALKYLETATHTDQQADDRNLILLDFYYYNLDFAKEQKFTPEQTSVFFSIMKETFLHSIASPFIHLQKDYQFFKDLLLQHCIYRPPYSQKVFSFNEMKIVNEYAMKTHYLMYKYAFTKKMRLDITAESVAEAATAAAAAAAEGKEGAGGEVLEQEVKAPSEPVQPDPKEEPTTAVQPQEPKPEPSAQAQPPQKDEKPSKQPESEKEAPEPTPEPPHLTPQEIAAQELQKLIHQTLSTKLDDLRSSLLSKMQAQEDQISAKLKRLEDKSGAGGEDEKEKKSAGAGGKEKGKKK